MALIGLLGCATSSPFNQNFVEVRTPNFHVTSSFGDPSTRALARDLEAFHSGVLAALGLNPAARRKRPTRVLAFDGRGVSRPFSERGATASLIPTMDGPILMIRADGDIRERLDGDLRHRYAHRILRDLSRGDAPLWYEEGRAQVAGTIDQRGDIVIVGRSNETFRRTLLDWRRDDLTQPLTRRSLADETPTDRRRFDAEAWAIVHTLLFDVETRGKGAAALDAVRVGFESNSPRRLESATRALGRAEDLTRRIYAHLDEARYRVDRLQVSGFALEDLVLERVPAEVARDRLAELALALDRPALASEYFGRALRGHPEYGRSLAGQVLADALEGRIGGIEGRVAAIEQAAESDPVILSRLGRALVVAGASNDDASVRMQQLRSARVILERVLELDPERIEAQMSLGSSFLAEGSDPARALAWFEAAQSESPGALEVNLEFARVAIRTGRPNTARPYLEKILSRSHSHGLRRKAREMLDSMEAEAGG